MRSSVARITYLFLTARVNKYSVRKFLFKWRGVAGRPQSILEQARQPCLAPVSQLATAAKKLVTGD
jgi:hypothetical protein